MDLSGERLMKSRWFPKTVAGYAVLYLALLCLSVLGQWLTGVYHSDLDWPDEGSHYVNGLMVHDYLADGIWQNPIDYAIKYYIHFPKVGIGHWPPLYYFIEGFYFIIAGRSIHAALLLEAIFTAGIAVTVGCVVGRIGGWAAAVVTSLATLAAPEIFLGMQGDMLDAPIAFATLLAALAWARFLFEGKWTWSAAFALLAAAAIMIKGNGIFLTLLPPLSLIFSRRLRLLGDWRFWLPVPIVAILTGPWYLATYKITAYGFDYRWGIDYVAIALPSYSWSLLRQVGIVGLLLAAIGAVDALLSREQSWRRVLAVSSVSFVISGLAFHSVVPAAIDGRYLEPLAPALIILAYFGVEWLVASRAPATRTLLMVLCFIVVVASESRFHLKPTRDMNEAADLIFSLPHKGSFVLVGSTAGGEGAFTAAVAAHDPRRTTYVVRGFQVLGSGNFVGSNYTPRFQSTDAMAQWIEGHGISWVVIDVSPQSLEWKHNTQLQKIAEGGRTGWTLAGSFPNSSGETLVYRVMAPVGSPIDRAGLLSELEPKRVIGR